MPRKIKQTTDPAIAGDAKVHEQTDAGAAVQALVLRPEPPKLLTDVDRPVPESKPATAVAIANEQRQNEVTRAVEKIAGLTVVDVGRELQQLLLLRLQGQFKHAIDGIINAMAQAPQGPDQPHGPTLN